jgi:ASCH domain
MAGAGSIWLQLPTSTGCAKAADPEMIPKPDGFDHALLCIVALACTRAGVVYSAAVRRLSSVAKALSIKQPWAWAIIEGFKDVENRSWPTSYRGPLFIHAGLKEAPLGWLALDRECIDFPCEVAKGGIIGSVDLVGCVEGYDSPWTMEDHYHWVLEKPRPRRFVPMRGKLGIFDVDLA